MAEVEIQNISRRFGDVVAVDSVSLSVRSGEFMTLLGPSGCGKTTLLRIIAGFEPPDEGRVRLGGSDVTPLPPYRRNVTTVFQHYALFPHMTVFENVAFGLRRARLQNAEVPRRVAGALELVNLTGLENRKPAEISGGQQQRVALARALVLEPRVLLLDEPLAALDFKLRKRMQMELKGLQRRLGISFVYVTHDQEEALTMSDRIAVMNAGRIEQIGTPLEVYEHPSTEFVAGFIGISNVITARVGDEAMLLLGSAKLDIRSDGATPGSTARVMIRPEKLRMSFDGDGLLAGRIDEAVYLGENTHWTVRLEDGQRIVVLEQNTRTGNYSADRIGSKVSLWWEPGSAVLLEGEAENERPASTEEPA